MKRPLFTQRRFHEIEWYQTEQMNHDLRKKYFSKSQDIFITNKENGSCLKTNDDDVFTFKLYIGKAHLRRVSPHSEQ